MSSAKTTTAKEPALPRKKRKWVIVAASVLLLASGGGGAAWYFGVRGTPADKAQAAPKKTLPVYLTLEPFVVNLSGSENYLQVGVVYALDSNEISDAIKAHLPAVRSRVLLRLSSKSVADLTSLEGKQKLIEEILQDAKASLDEPQRKGVATMHFSAFVIQ
jgi:flagellar FliL protein